MVNWVKNDKNHNIQKSATKNEIVRNYYPGTVALKEQKRMYHTILRGPQLQIKITWHSAVWIQKVPQFRNVII